MDKRLERVELLIKKEGIDILKNSTVLIIGVGGVGSYCAESLARSGVGKLVLVDKDVIDITNLNRQIHALDNTIGKSKVEVMKHRIESYSDCKVETYNMFYDKDSNYIFDGVDFVVDAIDTVTSKVDIMEYCLRNKIQFVSSMGMANRFDSSRIEYTRLDKTYNDPLAKACRELVKKRNIKGKIPVVFSKELPEKQSVVVNESGTTRKEKMPPATLMFTPSAAGILCGSVVVRELLGNK